MIAQGEADIAREKELDQDAQAALTTLSDEHEELDRAAANAASDIATASRAREWTRNWPKPEHELETLTRQLSDWNANKASHERGRDLAQGLSEASSGQLDDARGRLARAMEHAHAAPDVAAADNVTETARAASSARDQAAQARSGADPSTRLSAREPLEDAEREVHRLSAEVKALGDLLHQRAKACSRR